MRRPAVTVIIPTYKRSKTLRRSIDSVLAQTYKDFEILIVDDNAADEISRRSIRSLSTEYASVNNITFMFPNRNLGGGGARNFGAENARGKYLAFLDDDDAFLPEKLSKMMKRFSHADNDETINYCFARDTSGRKYDSFFEGNSLQTVFKRFTVAATSQLIIEKKSFIQSGGFELLPSKQDANLIMKMLIKGNKIICTPEILNIYSTELKSKISTNGSFRVGYKAMLDKFDQVKTRFSNQDKRVIQFSLVARQLREELHSRNVGASLKLMKCLIQIDARRTVLFVAHMFKQSYLDTL